jgi:probable F420-dependent oxidoreductase
VDVYVIPTFLRPEHMLEVAVCADQAGYYGCTMADHVMFPANIASKYPYAGDWGADAPFPDTWVTIAAMAAVTRQLRFISAIYLAPARPPVIVAKSVATAAILSGYRVTFGAGVGWMKEENDYTGQDFHTRGKRLDEMIVLLRRIWSGEVVEHHGTYYDYDPFVVPPAPKGPIPIWGGGDSERPMRRAAHLDGWIGANYYPLETALSHVERLHQIRREEGTDDREDFGILVGLDHPPTVDDARRLEQAGVTAIWASPWCPGISTEDPGIAVVTDALQRYAEDVVHVIGSN